MKKIIAIALAAAIAAASYVTSSAYGSDDDIIALLSELNIMVGDDDGNFRLDDNVSRAEFTKIAINSSSAKNTVASGMRVSPFRDVSYTHWSAPYVKAAVTAKIVEGYIDGTFRPDNTVSYEEALTMMLKVLGYTDEDFGTSWPYGQIGLAENLELTKNVNALQGEALTRGQVARLVYNTLDTKMKNSQTKLLSVFDCEIIEGVTIIASNREDSSIGTDKIFTSAGTFEFDGEFNHDYVGRRGDIIIKNGDDFVAFTPREQSIEEYTVSNVIGYDIILDGAMYDINPGTVTYYKSKTMTYETASAQAEKGDLFRLYKNANGSLDYAMLVSSDNQAGTEKFEKYVIYSQLADAVICYDDGAFTQIDIKDGTACYKDNVRSTYAAVKNDMEMGDILYVKRDGADIDYVSYEKGVMEGPIKVTDENWISRFDTNDRTAVMRGGIKASSDDIRVNDIIYYCADLNMILAYTDKVTGIYESAAPTKDSPTSVTVSGKEYRVESVEAFNALSSSGTIMYGDTVTLLLGRNGSVAGVASGNAVSTDIKTASSSSFGGAGFVVGAGRKDFTNADNSVYSSYYAQIVLPDGSVNEYATVSDSKSYICSAVRVTFKNGRAQLSRITESGLSGRVNAAQLTLGNEKLANDVKILDTSGSYSDDIPAYTRIYPQRVDGVTLSSSAVMYYSKNSAGEIDELILKDVTGDTYTYGVITRRDKTTGAYTIDIDGNVNTYMTGFSGTATGPHRFKMSGSTFAGMQQLASYGNVTSLSRTEAVVNGKTYLLSDKAVVYKRTESSTYMKIPLDDAINGSYRMTAYYDKAQSSGGRIRIIVAVER